MSHGIFQAERVTKVFPGTLALDHVDFVAHAASVNILVGENGAGKSTLMKILAGAEQPTDGLLLLDGAPVAFATPSDAAAKGIGIIYQELDLCPNLSVAENIFLGHECGPGGLVDRRRQTEIARQILKRLNHDINPNRLVGDLPVSLQQIVAIGKALRHEVRVLIMDEPTSALSAGEVRTLFKLIRDLKAQGVAIIYISHRLEELLEIGDYITVLRDGRVAAHAEMDGVDMGWILHRMLGDTTLDVPHHGNVAHGPPILTINDMTCPRTENGVSVEHVSLDVKQGEIVGLFGLMGAGRTELLECLMGLHPEATERIILGESILDRRLGLDERIARGMMLIPEDRQAAGIVQTMTLGENITLANLGRYQHFGWLSRNFGATDIARTIRDLAIKAYSPAQMITTCVDGPRGSRVDMETWRRFDCGHVFGLLVRHHGRWPRWVPRMASKHSRGIALPLGDTDFAIRRFDRSPSSPNALEPSAPARGSGGARLTPIRLTPRHHRPDDPGDLVGQRDRRDFPRLARQQSQQPG